MLAHYPTYALQKTLQIQYLLNIHLYSIQAFPKQHFVGAPVTAGELKHCGVASSAHRPSQVQLEAKPRARG